MLASIVILYLIACKEHEKSIFDNIDKNNLSPITLFILKNSNLIPIERGDELGDTLIVVYFPMHEKALYKTYELFLTTEFYTLNRFTAFRKKFSKILDRNNNIFLLIDTLILDKKDLLELRLSVNLNGVEKTKEQITLAFFDSTNEGYINHHILFQGSPKNKYINIKPTLVQMCFNYLSNFSTNINENSLRIVRDSLKMVKQPKLIDLLVCLTVYSITNDSKSEERTLSYLQKNIDNFTKEFTFVNNKLILEIFNKLISKNEKNLNNLKSYLNFIKRIPSFEFHYDFLKWINSNKERLLFIENEIKDYIIHLSKWIKIEISSTESTYKLPGFSINNFSMGLLSLANYYKLFEIKNTFVQILDRIKKINVWPKRTGEKIYLYCLDPKGIEGGIRSKLYDLLLLSKDTLSAISVLKEYIYDTLGLNVTKSSFAHKLCSFYLLQEDLDSAYVYLKFLNYLKHPIFFEMKKTFDSLTVIANKQSDFSFDKGLDFFYKDLGEKIKIKTYYGILEINLKTDLTYFFFVIDDNCPACNIGLMNFIKFIENNSNFKVKIFIFSKLPLDSLKKVFGPQVVFSNDIEGLMGYFNNIMVPDLLIIKDCKLFYHGHHIPTKLDAFLYFIK